MSATELSARKHQLRKQVRQRRRRLSQAQQLRAAQTICRRLSSLRFFQKAKHIALYLPNDGEISALPLVHLSWRYGKHCYLPRVVGQNMSFMRYRKGDTLQNNDFGIAEPSATSDQIDARKLDLVCMPLVAYDLSGNRLGMGGGFYDRSFAFRSQRHIRRPILVGLAHACQCVDELPTETWDQKLDYIVSDKHWLKFNA
ncbi:5-formyltetrahydrofolate cyclo-ligase [Agaribacterium haliotis]|uniref:5-formyltetrahydrofolate cyclo-ligase n=1 Tax=Agaribacterium haliotis TaxID=2013869 RepID=UPI000BB54503|nr:5-formyltetrahydrofolate cyclo-ligase [Agaribacterium haliotis]